MLSKSIRGARTAVLLLLLAGCGSLTPWRNERLGTEVNLAFTLENNLVFLTTAAIDGRTGRYFLGTAHPRSVVDPRLGASAARRYSLQLSEKEVRNISPVVLDLGGVGDAVIGAEAWGRHAVTVDYRSGLVTLQKEGIYPDAMTLFRYNAEPSITVRVDGRDVQAVVDTALPDTVVIPRTGARGERGTARVSVAGTDFGPIDVRYDDVSRPRIGNRVLSKFLVTIDYGRRVVGVWRDPRIPMHE